MRKIVLLLFCFVLFTGCAKSYKSVVMDFEQKRPCCASFREFSFEKLSNGNAVSFELEAKSDLYGFDTGKSYFKAFELPPYSSPYRLIVKSYMQGDHINTAYIFSPHILTLDSEYKLVRSLGKGLFKLKKTYTETWGLPFKHEGAIEFREENAGERYVVIMTTDELLGMNSYVDSLRFVPLIMPGFVGALPMGKEIKIVPHSPAGEVKLGIEPMNK